MRILDSTSQFFENYFQNYIAFLQCIRLFYNLVFPQPFIVYLEYAHLLWATFLGTGRQFLPSFYPVVWNSYHWCQLSWRWTLQAVSCELSRWLLRLVSCPAVRRTFARQNGTISTDQQRCWLLTKMYSSCQLSLSSSHTSALSWLG